MRASDLLLLRHGESVWNAQRRWQGQADPPLSREGRRQARAAVAHVRDAGPRCIVASDLRRARDTALPFAAALGIEMRCDPGWREWDVGAWSGRTRDEIRERWPEAYARFRAGEPDFAPPGDESQRAFEARVRAALGRLLERNVPGRTLVVSHRGPIRLLLPAVRPGHAELLRLHPLRPHARPQPP
jgi:broad specificity phosphatase PhoE